MATVTIKMKPYLVEYAKCKMGNGLFSNAELVCKIVRPFIRRIPKDFNYKTISGSDILEIPVPLISDLFTGDNKVYISDKDCVHISRAFEAHFNDALFSYVSDKMRYNAELKKCFIQFCSDYNICWENVNYDMLVKKYYRFRKRKEEKKTFCSSFPVHNLSMILPFML